MSCRLVLDGLRLEDSDFQRLRDKMGRIEELAPYNSSILCRLNWNGNDHVGVLTVKSIAENFVSVGVGAEIQGMTDRLFNDVKKKIFAWSQSRF